MKLAFVKAFERWALKWAFLVAREAHHDLDGLEIKR